MVGPTGQLWWLALRARCNGWPSCFDGGSHRAVVMVGLACPLQWIAQLMMWWWAPPGRCDGWPCVPFYNEWPTIVLVWGPFSSSNDCVGVVGPSASMSVALHARWDSWPCMPLAMVDTGPKSWSPFGAHHVDGGSLCHVWWLAYLVPDDGWLVGPIVIGPTCPLQWLALWARYGGWHWWPIHCVWPTGVIIANDGGPITMFG